MTGDFRSKICENRECQTFRGDHLQTQRRIQNAFKHLRYSFFENKFNGYEPLTIFAKKAILEIFNEFVPNAPFLYLLKKNDKAQSPLWWTL